MDKGLRLSAQLCKKKDILHIIVRTVVEPTFKEPGVEQILLSVSSVSTGLSGRVLHYLFFSLAHCIVSPSALKSF